MEEAAEGGGGQAEEEPRGTVAGVLIQFLRNSRDCHFKVRRI